MGIQLEHAKPSAFDGIPSSISSQSHQRPGTESAQASSGQYHQPNMPPGHVASATLSGPPKHLTDEQTAVQYKPAENGQHASAMQFQSSQVAELNSKEGGGFSGIPSPSVVTKEPVRHDASNGIGAPPFHGSSSQAGMQTQMQPTHLEGVRSAPPSMQFQIPSLHSQVLPHQQSTAHPHNHTLSAPLSPKGNPFDMF